MYDEQELVCSLSNGAISVQCHANRTICIKTDRQLIDFAWLRSAVHAAVVFPPLSSAALVAVHSPIHRHTVALTVHKLQPHRYDTIRYDSVYLTVLNVQ